MVKGALCHLIFSYKYNSFCPVLAFNRHWWTCWSEGCNSFTVCSSADCLKETWPIWKGSSGCYFETCARCSRKSILGWSSLQKVRILLYIIIKIVKMMNSCSWVVVLVYWPFHGVQSRIKLFYFLTLRTPWVHGMIWHYMVNKVLLVFSTF